MKKFLIIIASVAMAGYLQAQTPTEKKVTTKDVVKKEVKAEKVVDNERKEVQKMALKEHVCTPACQNGKHVYKHGEKGHVCTKECKANMETKVKKDLKGNIENKVNKEVKESSEKKK